MRQQLVLHNPATVSVLQRLTRSAHSLLGRVSGYIGSPVHGHMADGDDEGELVVGVAVGALVVGVMLGVLEVGVTLGKLDEGADDGTDEGVLDIASAGTASPRALSMNGFGVWHVPASCNCTCRASRVTSFAASSINAYWHESGCTSNRCLAASRIASMIAVLS